MWGTQNNVAVNMPGIVSDGRLFTNYASDALVAETLKKREGISSNEEYRRYLVNNTDQIMRYNYEHMAKVNETPYQNQQYEYGTPYFYKHIQEETKPFGYEETVAKQMYLTREQLDDKKRRLMKDDY
jgi:hypothetical protein